MGNSPKSLSEFYDFLGFMVIAGPNFSSPRFPERNIESVFSDLCEGIENIRAHLDSDSYDELCRLTAEAKSLYDKDDPTGAGFKIQDMEDVLRNRKYIIDKPQP